MPIFCSTHFAPLELETCMDPVSINISSLRDFSPKHCRAAYFLYLTSTGVAHSTLLLPTAAQRFVELDQRQQLVSSGLRQAQLCVEQISICIEGVEQAVDAALISQISQPRAVLQGRHQQFLLGANFFHLAILHQRVRDVAEGDLNRLLILNQR